MTITASQLFAIDDQLRKVNLLTNEELILELTDHFSEGIDIRMNTGLAFETALVEMQMEFGGRQGLQKMERQYNCVTFRHYDEVWKGYLRDKLRGTNRWKFALMYAGFFVTLLLFDRPTQFTFSALPNFLPSLISGFVGGILLGMPFWGYMWRTLRSGIHNPPTEYLFLTSRYVPMSLMLLGIGVLLAYSAPFWPPYLYEALLALIPAGFVLLTQSYHQMQELLFDIR